jgi:hypothetical protein
MLFGGMFVMGRFSSALIQNYKALIGPVFSETPIK